MLRITLRVGEYAKIGDDITIYNQGVHRIAISIEAPKDMKIKRFFDPDFIKVENRSEQHHRKSSE